MEEDVRYLTVENSACRSPLFGGDASAPCQIENNNRPYVCPKKGFKITTRHPLLTKKPYRSSNGVETTVLIPEIVMLAAAWGLWTGKR